MAKQKRKNVNRGQASVAAKAAEEIIRQEGNIPQSADIVPIRPGVNTGAWTSAELEAKVVHALSLDKDRNQSVAEIAEAWAQGKVTTAQLAHVHLKYGKDDSGQRFFQSLKTAIYRYRTAENHGTTPARYKTVKVNPKGVLIESEAKARKPKAAVTMDTKCDGIKKWVKAKGFALAEVRAFQTKMSATFAGIIAELEAGQK